MGIRWYAHLNPAAPLQGGERWRVSLAADPAEVWVARWDTVVTNWLEGINGQRIAYQTSQPAIGQGKAVVDVRVIPAALAGSAVYGDIGASLDAMIPGVDVTEIRAVPVGETSAQGASARADALAAAPSKSFAGSVVDSAIDGVRQTVAAAGAALAPVRDVLILAGALVLVYLFVRRGGD